MRDRLFRLAVSLGLSVVMVAWSPVFAQVAGGGKKTRQARRIAAAKAARTKGVGVVRPASMIAGCELSATYLSSDFDDLSGQANAYWSIACNLVQYPTGCQWSWSVTLRVNGGTPVVWCADKTSQCGDRGPNFHTYLTGLDYPHGTVLDLTWQIQTGPCALPDQSIAVGFQHIVID